MIATETPPRERIGNHPDCSRLSVTMFLAVRWRWPAPCKVYPMTKVMKIGVRHLALFGLCAMSFISYVDRVNISVAAPMIGKELGLSATELGLIFSAFAYPYAFMQIYGGWLADRFGPRRVLAILSALWALATVMTGVSSGVAS